MGWLVVLVRRVLWLLLISAAGGAAYAWWRDRDDANPPAPAEWPPLAPQRDTARSANGHSDGPDAPLGNASMPPDAAPTSPPLDESIDPSVPAAGDPSIVDPLVDTPGARSTSAGGAWVSPDSDGSCPVTHPVKVNDNSGIFHVPDGRFYARTRAVRCYTTPEAAEADGYRRAKN